MSGLTDNANSVPLKIPMGPNRSVEPNSDKMSEIKQQFAYLGDVPRCYFGCLDTEGVDMQLHYFCDASEIGYGTASYLRLNVPL